MDYYIDIIDTTDDTHTTIYENAQKDSINLAYSGADSPDELQVVGSSLRFNINVPRTNQNDAVFLHLFTGDETKYKVELKRSTDNFLIWQGFLLPDSYTEPYSGGTYFVDFESTDGLGRLKGKYLADDFYEDEKSVVSIIAACLELTGLEMNIILAPGIDNKIEKSWHNIYLNTSEFLSSSNKKDDAHKILETLCVDMVSCVYQYLGQWFFEGLNKRNLTTYDAKKYTYLGVYTSDYTVNKTVKTVTGKAFVTPLITMVPPYNQINVNYEGASVSFPNTIAKEANDGWVIQPGFPDTIYATDWYGFNDYYATAKAPNYKVYLVGSGSDNFSTSKFIKLAKKVYVAQGKKIKLSFEFEIDYKGNPTADTIESIIDAGDWTNPLRYNLIVGSTVLYSNVSGTPTTTETIQFDTNRKATLNFEFIPQDSGLLDFVLFQPFGEFSSTKILGVFINSMSIEEIGFEKDIVYSDTINEDYTIDKDVDITFSDNAAGIGKVFLLAKLTEKNLLIYNTIGFNVLYGATYSSQNYAVLNIDGANLVADNLDTVYYDDPDVFLDNLSVLYNYNGGEQMLVATDALYDDSDILTVKIYKLKDYDLDRSHWEQWTDSVYQVERKRYADAVLGVYRRLFDTPKPKIDLQVKAPVLFGDILQFNYIENQYYSVINCSLNFDSGKSDVTMIKAAYLAANSNLPPYVDAGPDLFLTPTQTSVFINATAFDPDGTITTYLWEKVSGDAGDIIVTDDAEDTYVNNLTGDDYTYRITVTDNDTNTANDTMRILRVNDYTITMPLNDTVVISTTAPDQEYLSYLYDFEVDPTLPDNVFINCNAVLDITITLNSSHPLLTYYGEAKIYKNSTQIASYYFDEIGAQSSQISFSYTNADTIQILIASNVQTFAIGSATVNTTFTLNTATIIDYPGVVLGLPIIKEAEVEI